MIFPVKRVKEELITVRAGGIEIDVPIITEETTLFKILKTADSPLGC